MSTLLVLLAEKQFSVFEDQSNFPLRLYALSYIVYSDLQKFYLIFFSFVTQEKVLCLPITFSYQIKIFC